MPANVGEGLWLGEWSRLLGGLERINPGDNEHKFETIRKIVSGQDERTLDLIAEVYGSVVTAGIYRAPSIKRSPRQQRSSYAANFPRFFTLSA